MNLFQLEFDSKGAAACPPQLDRLIAESKRNNVTDLVFLAHGFRCDAAEATALYTGLLTGLCAHSDRAEFARSLAGRTFAAAGVYWPSKEFRESFPPLSIEGSRAAQDEFVASVLSVLNDSPYDPTEGLPLIRQWRGSDLLDKLRTPTAQSRARDEGGIESGALVTPILDSIGTLLNFISWAAMKNLSGAVGANGVATAVQACQRELSGVRIHLAGHSLGGRLMAACCKTLAEQSAPRIHSLSLLEAAFSHFGFSPDAGSGEPGFFRGVIGSRIVSGPLIATFSQQDAVVGKAYALASRLAHDRLQAIGDATDPYGGIGRNGARRTPESAVAELHAAGQPYQFQSDVVTCLDGSSGFITGHGDVTNPHVTYAIASAVLS